MKEQFREISLNNSSMKSIDTINMILDQYSQQGYTLTLRQLYYQLVRRNLIANKDREYKKLSRLTTAGRMGGLIDWKAIEDRIRVPKLPYWVYGISDALSDTKGHYRLNRMKGQARYIEVWIEKDALSQIVGRVTQKYHIRMMVNRGYSSCTAMYQAAKRISGANGQPAIIYMGDHDPSGLDMVRDIEDRLNEFGVYPEIIHPALRMDQIEQYELPPNPAKLSDSRARDYIEMYGPESWELDALEPSVLVEVVENEISNLIDIDMYESVLDEEKQDKKELTKLIKKYNE